MDAWSHRSTTMRCSTCMFYVPKKTEADHMREKRKSISMAVDANDVIEEDPLSVTQLGRCRRHAPTVGQGWPAVFNYDWCGDHKLDENKR